MRVIDPLWNTSNKKVELFIAFTMSLYQSLYQTSCPRSNVDIKGQSSEQRQLYHRLHQYLIIAWRTHVISGLDALLSFILILDADRQMDVCELRGLDTISWISGLDADRLDTTDELRLIPQKHFLLTGSVLPRSFRRVSYWRLRPFSSGCLLMMVLLLLLFCCMSVWCNRQPNPG